MRSPAIRRVSPRAAVRGVAARSAALRLAVSLGMVEYPVEGIEVAPAPVLIETRNAPVHHQWDLLLGKPPVRAQRRIEAGKIVARRRATESHRAHRDHH